MRLFEYQQYLSGYEKKNVGYVAFNFMYYFGWSFIQQFSKVGA